MKTRKILVVDDEPALLRLLEMVLTRHGYRPILAENGATALELVRSEKPDLVILDVMMPEMDGFEVCRRLRRMRQGAEIPVIMLSAAGDSSAKVKGLQVGANDYVTKPMDQNELIARIEAQLRALYARVGEVIVVLSTKAGVGGTTIAVNLAVALKQAGVKEVVLIDWDRPIGDVEVFLGLRPQYNINELTPYVDNLDLDVIEATLTSHPAGVRVLASADNVESPLPPYTAVNDIIALIVQHIGTVVVDLAVPLEPQWTKVLRGADHIVLVATPDFSSLYRLRAFLDQIRELGLEEQVKLVLNREGIDGGLETKQIETHMKLSWHLRLPDAPELTLTSLNRGEPVILRSERKNPFARAMQKLVELLDLEELRPESVDES